MNVGAESDVVGQVPADMIWICIDHDVVAIPLPVVTVVVVSRGNAKEESVKAEALAIAPSETVDVSGTKGARKMSVLPGAIEVVTRVVSAGIVADPSIRPGIHVRSIRMAGLLGKLAELTLRRRSTSAIYSSGSAFGRSATTIRGGRSAFGRPSGSGTFRRPSRCGRRAARGDMPTTDGSGAGALPSSAALGATAPFAATLLCKGKKGEEK